MRKILVAMVSTALLGAGGVAQAQGAGGVHTHDGFFLQMDLGAGSMASELSGPGGSVELSGVAGEFSIAVGFAVVNDLVVAGHFWGTAVAGPDVKLDGQTLGTATDAVQSLSAIGVNLTYYVMPLNLYLSATPSIGTLTIEENGQTLESKSGFAIRLAVGKEWWVSDNWGLGLNVQYAHSSNDADVANPPTWGTNWFGVAFSATYN